MWPFRREKPAEENPAGDEPVVADPEIPGREEVVKWFGDWPSFHDAEIVELHLERSGPSWIRLYLRTVSGDSIMGHVTLEKHAVVTFALDEVLDLQLAGFSVQNAISSLRLTRRGDHYRIELHPCFGLAGFIDARSVTALISPGRPEEMEPVKPLR